MFKNNAQFKSWISKVDSTLIDNAEDLDIVIPMYNLLEYSQNYSMTPGGLWNYYRDEIDNVDGHVSDGPWIKYKIKIVEKTTRTTPTTTTTTKLRLILTTTTTTSTSIKIKCWSCYFTQISWSLINYEKELDFSWSKLCIVRTW